MNENPQNDKPVNKVERAKHLRATQTKSEGLLWGLLWGLLRASQLCGLKFRRQHPIGPFYADFACKKRSLVVEIDGGYHDAIAESDLSRGQYLKQNGWEVIRFSDEEVEEDTEAVGRAIAKHVGLKYEFRKRKATGSGMENENAPKNRKL